MLCISLTRTWNEFNNRWNWQNFKIYASHLFRLSAVPRRKYFYSDTWQLMRHIKLYKHSYIILYSQTAKNHHRIFSASAHNFRVCVFILNQISLYLAALCNNFSALSFGCLLASLKYLPFVFVPLFSISGNCVAGISRKIYTCFHQTSCHLKHLWACNRILYEF